MPHALGTLVAEAAKAIRSPAVTHGSVGTASTQYELFHAPASICSQKVRAVLAHHGLEYVGHSLNLFEGETYLPEYVRLRMVGCMRYGGELVTRHSGSTATAAGGCDGAVVPTLIDWQDETVIVDSMRICVTLDEQQRDEQRLRPTALTATIDAELEIIDHLPNYQMLMGRAISTTEATASRSEIGASFSERKVAWCDHYLAKHADEPALVAAYTAKRAKEGSAAAGLFTPDAMQAAYDRAERAVADLDRKLAQNDTPWLIGEGVTMADLFWGIELLRMENTGFARFWKDLRLSNVEAYASATAALPAIRRSVIDWPGAMF